MEFEVQMTSFVQRGGQEQDAQGKKLKINKSLKI